MIREEEKKTKKIKEKKNEKKQKQKQNKLVAKMPTAAPAWLIASIAYSTWYNRPMKYHKQMNNINIDWKWLWIFN